MPLAILPIDAVLPRVVDAVRARGAVVLRAPAGAGKTTRVPPALLDAGLAGKREVIILQPRRIAARAAARRMAWERGSPLGGEIGYQVRFDRRTSGQTRIRVVTEGVLLRMLQDDPFLEAAGAVVLDEFHERSLSSDLALAMVRRVRDTVRPDLCLVVMSATLDPTPVAHYLGGCPTVESEGRLYPIEFVYREEVARRPLADGVADAVGYLLDRTPGDLLVFLPGVGEIHAAERRLERLATQHNLAVTPLYGELSPERQDEAIRRGARRKVVLTTNVAETSVTVEAVTGVVDTGLARRLEFDPGVGLDRLALVDISQASADQRAGRAGRTSPGVCLRLWAERTHRLRPPFDEPEVRRLDLAGPVLQLRAWGERDLEQFPWFEAPRAEALAHAERLLVRLGAFDAAGGVTAIGQNMARWPLSPRLARMLIEGYRLGQPEATALACALLSERAPFAREAHESGSRRRAVVTSNSDILDRVAALEEFERSGRVDSPLGELARGAAHHVLHARDQILRESRRAVRNMETASVDDAVRRALLVAFPDRLCRRSSPTSPFGRMVGGRGVRLAPSSAVVDSPLFLAVDVERAQSESFVRLASAVEPGWLPPERLTVAVETEFDPATRRVSARRRLYWEDLLLEETPAALNDEGETTRLLVHAAAEALDEVFPWDDLETTQYLQRLRCLGVWLPELAMPSLDDDALRALLADVAGGQRSFDDLRHADWRAVLRSRLTPEQQGAVEREVPERFAVPSGSRIRIHYEAGRPPVLAVRIQELFGLRETPRIARGRVPLLLHLLAPNLRTEQITDDLASFWQNTYQRVRKDLRRRYPKHSWPEDPYQATAERRPRPRQ